MKTSSFALLLAGVLAVASCGNAPKDEAVGGHQFDIKKVTDYLYEVTLDYDYDYDLAKPGLEKYRPQLGKCSAISVGNLRGRNLDWVYADGVEFVLRSTKTDKRHASIGIVTAPTMPNEMASDGQYHKEFESLPYVTMDGINDAGICLNLNVVNFQEFGPWQMKTETTDDDMMEFLAVRMILDNCTYMTDIVPMMDQYDWFSLGNEEETHLMVTGPRSADDPTVTSVVFEYIPFTEEGKTFRKVCCISQDAKDLALVGGDASRFHHSKADIFIMTNFNLWKFDASLDRKGRLLSATENPMGFERYETLEAATRTVLRTAGSEEKVTELQMQDIMRSVYYSKNYNLNQPNWWYTEESKNLLTKEEIIKATEEQRNPGGDINKILKGKDNQYYNHIEDLVKAWGNRDRKVKGNLWETLHTSVYNYKERTLQVNVHEGTLFYEYKL